MPGVVHIIDCFILLILLYSNFYGVTRLVWECLILYFSATDALANIMMMIVCLTTDFQPPGAFRKKNEKNMKPLF